MWVTVAVISIHAPREGRDAKPSPKPCAMYISIHAPREGRDDIFGKVRANLLISIHAPREGRDAGSLQQSL